MQDCLIAARKAPMQPGVDISVRNPRRYPFPRTFHDTWLYATTLEGRSTNSKGWFPIAFHECCSEPFFDELAQCSSFPSCNGDCFLEKNIRQSDGDFHLNEYIAQACPCRYLVVGEALSQSYLPGVALIRCPRQLKTTSHPPRCLTRKRFTRNPLELLGNIVLGFPVELLGRAK